jgi:hypothetical protein
MKKKTAAAFAIVAGGFAAWYAMSAQTEHAAPARFAARARAPLDARGDALLVETARLRRRSETAAPPRPARDIFRFATRAPAVAPVVLVIPPVANTPVLAPAPAFRLVGVAEDTSAAGPVRTAIISAPGQLYVVREGEQVTSRYSVARILPDLVELVDTGGGNALRLALK